MVYNLRHSEETPMKFYYYVDRNPQPSSAHEVHRERCLRIPDIMNRAYLGFFKASGRWR